MKMPKLLKEFQNFNSVGIRLESKELPKYMNLVVKRLLIISTPPNAAINSDDSIWFQITPKGKSLLNQQPTMSDKALDNCLSWDN